MLEINLSYAQREILEVENFSPNTGSNNIGGLVTLNSSFSYDEINDAINIFIDKNEIVRTRMKYMRNESKYGSSAKSLQSNN